MKICRICGKNKRIGSFGLQLQRSGNRTRRSACIKCLSTVRTAIKNRSVENIERAREAVRKSCRNRRRSVDGWCGRTVSALRFKSIKRNIPFDLTIEYVRSIFPVDGKCPALRRDFVMGDRSMFNPTLDRIKADRGYVMGNVVIVSRRANWVKNDASHKEIQMVAKWLKSALDLVR